MKRLIIFICISLLCISCDNTIKFMGIPVDGNKAQMIKKLEAKGSGFKYNPESDNLSGTFNGKSSEIYVTTNNDRVNRVCVISESFRENHLYDFLYRCHSSESIMETLLYVNDLNRDGLNKIKESYNSLINQFKDNDKYIAAVELSLIPGEEDISLEMERHDKEYKSAFYPKNLLSAKEIKALENNKPITINASGIVWFKIEKFEDYYFIALYYDNFDNMPNGEDL